jgi:CRP-like cAMP-binding protein
MPLGLLRARTTAPRLTRLRTLSLFVELTAAELAVVDSLLHERDYLSGEVVFDQEEEGQAIYIILDGEVAIRRHDGEQVEEIARLGAGNFFGELALLDSAPRMAEARAATACKLAVFFRDDFLGLLDTHGRIASKITRQLARHIGRRLRELAIAAGAHQHL